MNMRRPSRARQRGLSLIESMVALVLTLALIAGVAQMLVGTQGNIRNQNDRSSMDDEARFAVEYLSRAGFRAGFKRSTEIDNDMVFPEVNNSFPKEAVVFGTDTTLSLRYQGHADGQMATCHNDAADQTNNPFGVYVETWSLNNNALRCALTQPDGTQSTEPLSNNVEAIRFQYGVVTVQGGDYPDTYRNAADMTATDWEKVRSVVIGLRLVSTNDNLAETPQPYIDFDGNSATPNDRRLRRTVFTTVALRNLLP